MRSKGLACALIVGHHLARYGPLPAGASTLAPGLFEWLAQDGRLAVQVFLVIAGFLAAGSLAPDGVLRIDRPLLRVFQRYGRLAMPYLAALCVSVLAAALVRPWLIDEAVPPPPGMAQLLAHGLLLQDLLGYEALSTGVWYVAIDFQLFVLALLAIGLSELLQRRWVLAAGARALAGGGPGAGAGRCFARGVQPQCGAGRHGALFLRRLRPGHAGVLDRPRHAAQHLAVRGGAADAGRRRGAGARLAQPHRDCAGHGAAAGRGAAARRPAHWRPGRRWCGWGASLTRCS